MSPSNEIRIERAASDAAFWRRHAERLAQEIRSHRQNSAAQGLELRTIDARLYGVERAVAEQTVEHRDEPAPSAATTPSAPAPAGPRLAVA